MEAFINGYISTGLGVNLRNLCIKILDNLEV